MFLTATPRLPDPTEQIERLAAEQAQLFLLGAVRPFDTVPDGDKRYSRRLKPDGKAFFSLNELMESKSCPEAERFIQADAAKLLKKHSHGLDVVSTDQTAEKLLALIERFAESIKGAILVVDSIFKLKDADAAHLATAMGALKETGAFGTIVAPTLAQTRLPQGHRHNFAHGVTPEMQRYNDKLHRQAPTIQCGVSPTQRGLLIESGWELCVPKQDHCWNAVNAPEFLQQV